MPRPDPKVTFAVLLAGGDDGGEVLLLRPEGHVDGLAEGGLSADAAELLPDEDTVISSVRIVRSQNGQDGQDCQGQGAPDGVVVLQLVPAEPGAQHEDDDDEEQQQPEADDEGGALHAHILTQDDHRDHICR